MDQIAQAMTTFKIFTKGRLIASRTDGSDGQLRIEGVASSTIRDHHGDEITEKALRKMAGSAVGMTIFLNHEYRVPQDVFGTVERAKVVKSGEVDKRTGQPIYDMRIGVRVAKSNKTAVDTFELIESDAVKLGISVGAMVPEGGATFAKSGGGRYVVDDADLVEASIISLPANSRSWVDHAVKALADIKPGPNGSFSQLLLAKRMELLKQMGEDEPAELVQAELGDVVELTSDGEGSSRVVAKAGTPEAEAFHAAAITSTELEKAGPEDEEDFVADEPEPEISDEATESVVDPPEDLEKTRVSVWKDSEGGEVVEVDTGRSRPKADEDLTPQAIPENGGDPTSIEAGEVVKSLASDAGDPLVKALTGQLNASRAENAELVKERDVALEIAKRSIDGTRAIVSKLAELPVGRKTQDGRFADPDLQKADETLDRLAGGVYDADVIKMLKK